MSWINEISYADSTGSLRKLYDRIKGPDNKVDNVLSIHSLRPHSMEGHLRLYKNVLHHRNNQLPKWYLETVGVFVSMLNHCDYCVQHHSAGLKRLLEDESRYKELCSALINEDFTILSPKQAQGLRYTQKLTREISNMVESDIHSLRETGYDDGEILELNQVVSYFNYANRTVLGLGVSLEGDILGLSPNDDQNEENWGHQ